MGLASGAVGLADLTGSASHALNATNEQDDADDDGGDAEREDKNSNGIGHRLSRDLKTICRWPVQQGLDTSIDEHGQTDEDGPGGLEELKHGVLLGVEGGGFVDAWVC